MKKIVVTCGPIPARLDSVKYLTNMFKGGLAFKTASWLARYPDFEVTVVCWKHTRVPEDCAGWHALVTVNDVFEYYDWIAANARNYDAFVTAAAVANLTPVKPYEGKFPSHNYRPGDEFDIKFMIAPRAIDAIKPLNPRACVIGYKLFDEPDDDKLTDIARHTLDDARANIIFANRPLEAKNKKIAVFPDGSAIPVDFDGHMELISRAIKQEYFRTETEPLSESEKADPNIREALAAVGMYENTFEKYGTVAIPVDGHPGMFATTSRGHLKSPVIVRSVDPVNKIVRASGKATLNAPALSAMLANYPGYLIIHRHFNDENADQDVLHGLDAHDVLHGKYLFPGTAEEYEKAAACTSGILTCPRHGYLAARPIRPVDWTEYNNLFPEHYFKPQCEMLSLVQAFREKSLDVLEIGGNKKPMGNLSYDPYVAPDPDFARAVDDAEVDGRTFPLAVCFNAINYLSRAEIAKFVAHSKTFAANTFRQAPEEKITSQEYAVLDKDRNEPVVRHGLRLPGDGLMRHKFHAYDRLDYEGLGLSCWEYGRNSMVVYRGIDGTMGRSALTDHALDIKNKEE